MPVPREEEINKLLEFSMDPAYSYTPEQLFKAGYKTYYNSNDIDIQWRKLVEKIQSRDLPELLNFYVHVPFCKQKCTYCMYHSIKPAGDGIIDNYLNNIADTFLFFKNIFKPVTFRNLYIGGGTPGILSTKQLDKMLGGIFSNFRFHDSGERSFEFNPVFVDHDKLGILKNYGFNRISMGVQTYSASALKYANREYQTSATVSSAIKMINAACFDRGLNVDLIRSLHGDTPASFVSTLEKIAGMNPSMITIYPLMPPNSYVDNYLAGDQQSFRTASMGFSNSLIDMIRQSAVLSGYHDESMNPSSVWVLNRSNTMVRKEPPPHMNTCGGTAGDSQEKCVAGQKADDTETGGITRKMINEKFTYDDLSLSPYSLFGVGPTAISHIWGLLRYKGTRKIAERFDPDEKIYRGKTITVRDEMARYIIICFMIQGFFSSVQFRSIFGVDAVKYFSGELDLLRDKGFLDISDTLVSIKSRDRKDILFCSLVFFST